MDDLHHEAARMLPVPHGSHVYKVGIMSDVRYVLAPTARAAALFYGLNATRGNMQLGAAVYERDGEEDFNEPDALQWLKYQFGGGTEETLKTLLDEVKQELAKCRWWPSPKSVMAVMTAAATVGEVPSPTTLYDQAMAVERKCEW